MTGSTRALGALVITVAVLFAACSGDDVETGTVAGRAGGDPVAGSTTIDVDASNFEFAPDRIEIGAGEQVAIALRSKDGPHDLAIDGLGRVADVGAGGSDTERLRIDERGRYTFFCTLPGHRDGGMEGTIVVN